MKTKSFIAAANLLGICVAAFASSPLGGINAGGGRSSSASYGMETSVGNIAGNSSGGSVRNLAGGTTTQPAAATNLALSAVPAPVSEASTNQLSGVAALDDGSMTALSGSDIGWTVVSGPILAISASGAVTTTVVCADTQAVARGIYLGASNAITFTVLDSDPDNYGLYAADSIPDAWQMHFFGMENPLGMASATNCTGHANLYTYTADLDPTNPASSFAIVAISNQVSGRLVWFGSTSTGRVYRLLYATNLVTGVWTNLPGQSLSPGQAGLTSLGDTGTNNARFYHVQVQVP